MYAVLMSEFGDKLRTRRERGKLSLQEVADRAKISRAYVSRLEAGNRNPSRPVVRRLSNALNWEIQDAMVSAGFLPDESALVASGYRPETLGYYKGKPIWGAVPQDVTEDNLRRVRFAVRVALQEEGIVLDADSDGGENSNGSGSAANGTG